MTRCLWFLVVSIILSLLQDEVDGKQIPKPKACNGKDTWFRHRRRYVYNYRSSVSAGFVGTTEVTSGSLLACVVTLSVPKKCEAVMQVTSCKLKERGLNGRLSPSSGSEKLASDLAKHAVYVQVNGGRVVEGTVVLATEEPVYVANIKRAILSQLQLPLLHQKLYDQPVIQSDIFGECRTHFSFDRKTQTVQTKRDISTCKLPQVFGEIQPLFAFAKQFQAKVLHKPIDELIYPFHSQVDCDYKIGSKKIARSHCFHSQAFQPITYDNKFWATPTINVTQTLTLTGSPKLSKKQLFLSRNLKDRSMSDLKMDLQVTSSSDVTLQRVTESLDAILVPFSSQTDEMPPQKFRELVDSLRGADEEVLEEVMGILMTCRGNGICPLNSFTGQLEPAMVQKLRESFFTDGLLSCGTEACVSVYLASVQNQMTFSIEGELSLFSLALFYRPNPGVIDKMLALCKFKNSHNCWLSLGTLVGKMAAQSRDSEDRKYVTRARVSILKVLRHLRTVVGDLCKGLTVAQLPPGEQGDKLDSLLIALKTLGNAGGAIKEFHDAANAKGKPLVPAVIQCVNNKQLPSNINSAAFLVLRKLDLEKAVVAALFDLLSDPSHRISLRTMAFDRLILHENKGSMSRLMDMMTKEPLVNVKLYILTRLHHFLEANDPNTESLRELWRYVIEQRQVFFPPLESFESRGSEYAEFSRYFFLPLTRLYSGAKLGVSVIYRPSHIAPTNVRLAFSVIAFNRSMELLELGLELDGMENMVRELLGRGFSLDEGIGAFVARVMQSALPREGEAPTQIFPDQKVLNNLLKILARVNMPKGDHPLAELSIKVFGNEVGYVHLNDLIRMVKDSQRGNDKNPPTYLTLGQRLNDGLQLLVGKSSTLMELVKVIPTVAGLPWRADVQGTMVSSAMMHAQGDVQKFVTRQGPLEIKGGLTTSVGVQVLCQGRVQIGDVTSSGIRVNISVLANIPLEEARLKYAPVPPSEGAPGAQVLELGLGALKRPVSVVSIRNDLYQLQNGEEKAIQTPDTQTSMSACSSPFFQTWSGGKLCLTGFYQPMVMNANTPLAIMSGPVHLDVTARAVDTAIKEHAATFTFTREPREGVRGTFFNFKVNASAPGEQMQRRVNFEANINPTMKMLHTELTVPEFRLRYDLDVNSTLSRVGGRTEYHLLSSVLSVGPDVLHSAIVEKTHREMSPIMPQLPPESERLVKVNISFPGVSVEVKVNTTSGVRQRRMAQNFHTHLRYYCAPSSGLLYALHVRPDLAARSSHVSEWSFSNKALFTGQPLSSQWGAEDIMTILIPGHNVTLVNNMAANQSQAFRDSVIYWKSGMGTPQENTDIIRMEAEVRNNSVGGLFDMNYVMSMEHEDKYDVKLKGQLYGPINDIHVDTDIAFKAKEREPRERRSLRGFYAKLRKGEEKVIEAVETAEQAVVRRGAELTESLLMWLSGETPPKPGSQEAGEAASDPGSAVGQRAMTPDCQAVAEAAAALPSLWPLLQTFSRPEWALKLKANVQMKPRMMSGQSEPAGVDYHWKVDAILPDLDLSIVAFNGSLERGPRPMDVTVDCHVLSALLNVSVDLFHEQKLHYPKIFFSHSTNFTELNTHRADRRLSWYLDLERHDHFDHRLEILTPSVNVSHAINFSTLETGEVSARQSGFSITKPQSMRVVRAKLDASGLCPVFHVRYREKSNLTNGPNLVADVTLNSTWLDLTLDLDVDVSPRKGIFATAHLGSVGKVWYLNGSSRLDGSFKYNSNKPTLKLTHTDRNKHVKTVMGELLDPKLLHLAFSSQKGRKTSKHLDWYMGLKSPTVMHHSFQWKPAEFQELVNSATRFYRVGSHSFMLFGQTVADNVYRNVTDMVIPFTNTTISQAVDRISQGQMRQVAMAGLDPQTNVPWKVKVLKGGLKAIQSMQTTWQNSTLGKLISNSGIPSMISRAARHSTSLFYMVIQDPPFPLRQLNKFYIRPTVERMAQTNELNLTMPLPAIWDEFMSMPKLRMLSRQFARLKSQHEEFNNDFPFVAVITPDTVRSFDGALYNISLINKATCTYILATDLSLGNYSVFLRSNGTALALTQGNVFMDSDGGLTVTDLQNTISELPAKLTSEKTSISLKDGRLTVYIPRQVRISYDPVSRIHVIETARHVQNRSLGLLGTPTREPGDEMQLSTGQQGASPHAWMQHFELSGQGACSKSNMTYAPLKLPCGDKSNSVCYSILGYPRSYLSKCFSKLNHNGFKEMCEKQACSDDSMATKVCDVVKAYIHACDLRGVHLDIHHPALTTFLNCTSCPIHRGKVDMVLGLATSTPSVLPQFLRGVGQQLANSARVGLVHPHGDKAQAHLFDGQLFISAREVKSRPDSSWDDISVTGQADVDAVVESASNYPFVPHARRLLVLFTEEQVAVEDLERLEKRLLSRDVSLVLVSPDAEADKQRVLYAAWDGKGDCTGCRKASIAMPQTEMGQLAQKTHGTWMSMNVIQAGRRFSLKKLARSLRQLINQPSLHCSRRPVSGA